MSITHLRKNYDLGALNEQVLDPDPIKQFQGWLETALKAELKEPTAMALATADAEGKPSVRMVLLKEVDQNGFTFYTNYESRKGKELAQNPYAALNFYWDSLERQVRIEGSVNKVSRQASEQYFKSRPYGSQLGALASAQSSVLASRESLEEHLTALTTQYSEGNVPLPENWGGYLLEPQAIEFWQGRPNRLHDRLRYRKVNEGWLLERLAP